MRTLCAWEQQLHGVMMSSPETSELCMHLKTRGTCYHSQGPLTQGEKM